MKLPLPCEKEHFNDLHRRFRTFFEDVAGFYFNFIYSLILTDTVKVLLLANKF